MQEQTYNNKDPNFKQRYYEEVGKNQVYLTEEEEIELVDQYKRETNELKKYVLSKPQCRAWIVGLHHATKEAGRSFSKYNAAFNTRVKGLSKRLEVEMDSHMDAYLDAACTRSFGLECLFRLNLSDWCYAEMIKLMPQTRRLKEHQTKIAEIEDTLLKSMLMVAHEIAYSNASKILSIDEADAVQEVQLYILESIRKYDPDFRTAEGERVKLCTYAYSRSERLLQEWILTSSRLVRIPRNKMGRMLTVVKAYETLADDEVNLYTLTAKANKLQAEKMLASNNKPFTVEEVDGLVKILTSNYIHLDQPFNRHNRMSPTTIGEMIPSEEPPVTELLQAQDKKEQLIELMEDELDDVEFKIMMLRYFHDPYDSVPKALTEIGPLLKDVYGGENYSRESIRKIERSALQKLKEAWRIKRLW